MDWTCPQTRRYGLTADQVLVDLYYVARLEGDEFRLVSPFGRGKLRWKTNRELADQSNSIAGTALDRGVPVVNGCPSGTKIVRDDAGQTLQEGVYLAVFRGKDITDYARKINVGGTKTYITIARSEGYEFHFLPTLVVLTQQNNSLVVEPKQDIVPLAPTPVPPGTTGDPSPDPTPDPAGDPSPGPEEPADDGPLLTPPTTPEPSQSEDEDEFDYHDPDPGASGEDEEDFEESDTPNASNPNAPPTGDETNLNVWIGATAVSLTLIVLVLVLRRRSLTMEAGEEETHHPTAKQ